MHCEHCGAPLADGATQCPTCGKAAAGVKRIKTRRPDAFDALGLLFCGVAAALVILGFVGREPTANAGQESPQEETVEEAPAETTYDPSMRRAAETGAR